MSNPFNSPEFGASGKRRPEDQQQGFQQQGYQQYPQHQQNAPMQPMGSYGAPVPVGTQKSKVVAAVLAFFLGTLGIHNFYLGYTSRAVCQLVLTIIGYVTAILLIGFLFLFCVGIWAFVEFIMILVGGGRYSHDARGLPLN